MVEKDTFVVMASQNKGKQKRGPTKGNIRPKMPGEGRGIKEHFITGSETTKPDPIIKGPDTTSPNGSGKGKK